jgi:hypothetical protein
MNNQKGNKIFKRVMIVFGILIIVLTIHIYWVTRPKPISPNKIVMARIDIKNHLSSQDADKIQTWLYQQKGVNHVVVNPKTQIALFTFYPAKVSGDQIVNHFRTFFNYDAKRYIPTQEELDKVCPALPATVTQKIASFVKHTF